MSFLVENMRKTAALATPIALGSVSQIAMGLIDSAMVGRVGTVPLAASAIGGSIFGFFFVVGMGLLSSLSVYISEAKGAGRHSEASLWLSNGFSLALAYVFGALLVIGLLLSQLQFLGAPPDVVKEARPFLLLMGISLLPAMLWQCLKQYAEALGHPWLPMGVMVGCVVFNTAMNWVLIYGHLGFPALGLTGSGISTLAARCLGTLLLALILCTRLPRALRPNLLPRLDKTHQKDLLRLGIPGSGQLFFEVGAFSAAAIMMGWLGSTALAAHQIALSCANATFMIPVGIGLATGMRIAQAQGAGEHAHLRSISLAGLVTAWGFMGVASLLLLLIPGPIAAAFTPEPSVRIIACQLLMVAALFQLFDGTQVVAACALRGLRDVRIPTLVTIIAYWGLAIPCSYFLGVRLHNPAGIWLGLALGLGFAAVFLALRLLRATKPRWSGPGLQPR